MNTPVKFAIFTSLSQWRLVKTIVKIGFELLVLIFCVPVSAWLSYCSFGPHEGAAEGVVDLRAFLIVPQYNSCNKIVLG